HLHRHGADSDPHHWRGCPYNHWSGTRGRLGTSPHHGPSRLFPHDKAFLGFELPVDRHLFWRADPWHLVLVYRPGDLAALAISPPISACFILGILWPRLNGSGAIASLLTGFVMGAARFVMELADRASGGHFDSPAARWLIDMNFLHYAIFMFVVCSVVLIGVSLMTPAPDRKRFAGLNFATVGDKMETIAVGIP